MSIAVVNNQLIQLKPLYCSKINRHFGYIGKRTLYIRATNLEDAVTIAWFKFGVRPSLTFRHKPRMKWGDYLPTKGEKL